MVDIVKNCYLKTVFQTGNGRISEMFAEWIIYNHVSSEKEVQGFLAKSGEYFPLSSSIECVTAHMAWEYFRFAHYNKTRDYPGLLRQSLKFRETASYYSEKCRFQAHNLLLRLGPYLQGEGMH